MEKIFKLNLEGQELKVDLADLAEQSSGSCLVQYGDTLLLITTVISKRDKDGINFFPLTVDYEEKYYAAGKILGSRYIRRESRPSDEAIITARLIDRAIRPRFDQNLKREVQVIVTCLSWDRENDPDVIGLLGASIALSNSEIPWQGPLAAVRIAQVENEFILNPTYEQREKSNLDLVLGGLEENNEILINMIEGEGLEVSEEMILQAINFARPYLKKLVDFQKEITKAFGKTKIILKEPTVDPELEKEIKDFLSNKMEKAAFQENKTDRVNDLNALKEDLLFFVNEKYSNSAVNKIAEDFFEKDLEKLIHENIIKLDKRPDNRKPDELRKIDCRVNLLPRTHGSGLFCRGETKALSILTLGAPGDVRLLEGMEIIAKKRFMHHYNFPPYSVGEVKPIRGPGRREIGHGMLAEKALLSLIPNPEEFPYTIRIVTEILSSNGSSSMAAVSASSLALMDAGVPIKRAVTGIALGLMKDEKGDYKILTDIQGPEDHYGDMDLKVAGTQEGITALQMDVKIKGVNEKIIKQALDQAKKARLEILSEMKKTIESPRPTLSPHAPRVLVLQINPEKIREVIGPGGKMINEIIDKCGVSIDIEDNGQVFVTGEKEESTKKAIDWINNITREAKVGEMFEGKITRILDFGAFVEFLPGQEGLIHISQLAPYHVKKVQDVVNIGENVPVKVISIDDQGRINLSLKAAKEEIDQNKKEDKKNS